MLTECSNCKITVQGKVIGSYQHTNPHDPTDGKKISLVKCPKCCNPILMKSDVIYEMNKFWNR